MTETAKFALELEDGISGSSKSAEDALKTLQSQIDKDTKSLSEMKKAMRQMQAGGSVDVSAYRKLKGEIDATQESIGKARAAYVNLGGDFTKIKKPKFPPKNAPKEVNSLKTAITGLTGALGLALSAIVAVVAVLVAMAAVLGAVAVATAKATVELVKYAVAQSDAMRSERLRLQGLGTLRRWMRLTAKDSAQMSESINRVAERVPLARSAIAGLGQELHRIGIRGPAAQDALEALSIAQAVQGDLGRQRLMMLIRTAGHSEGAMRNLAERVRNELGGIATQQMMSLTMISTKLKESFQALFAGVNLGPFLSGIYRLTRLISQSTESGRALKAIITAIVGAIIGPLAGSISPVEFLLKELVIAALKVAIAFFQIKNRIQQAFGNNIIKRMLKAGLTMENIKIAFTTFLIIAGLVGAAFVFLGFVLIGLITPFVLLAMAIHKAYNTGKELYKYFETMYTLLFILSWEELGGHIIDGIVAGLSSGLSRLKSGVLTIASTVTSVFRNALGISSPSKVFTRFGLAIPQGITSGVEQGGEQANRAVGNLISNTTAPNNINNARSQSVSIGDIHIHLGPGNNEDTAEQVTDALQEFFLNAFATEGIS